jgi:ATP-dependent Lhr-like helicase
LRGEVRGGRFVEGVAGEQYAGEEAVVALRASRDLAPDNDWLLLSAADPLNLAGIVGGGQRVPAIQRNYLVLAAGRWVAACVAGRVDFWQEVEASQAELMRHALGTGRRGLVREAPVSAGHDVSSSVSPAALRREARLAAIRQR